MTTTKSRKPKMITEPRVVGGVYRSGYWGTQYTVNAIEIDAQGWLKWITVTDKDGTRTHRTMWDARRDSIISTPESENV